MSIAREFVPAPDKEYPTAREIIELDDKMRKVDARLLLRMPLGLTFRLNSGRVYTPTSTNCRNIICERRTGVVTTDNNIYLLCGNERSNGLVLFKFNDTKLTIQSVGRSSKADLNTFSECFAKEFGFNDSEH